MKVFITVLLTFTCLKSYGQAKEISGVLNLKGDTSFWYRCYRDEAKKLSLHSLDTCKDHAHYRIWTNRQVIELVEGANELFTGKLITWTDEHVPHNERPTGRSFIISRNLSPDTALMIKRRILSSDILALPTDDSIKGWHHGHDGLTYIIEFSTQNHYQFKHYWTPTAHEHLKEAMQVQVLIDTVFKLATAQESWVSFSQLIPFECFINGGPGVGCKALTKKERRRRTYFKERERYRKAMRL